MRREPQNHVPESILDGRFKVVHEIASTRTSQVCLAQDLRHNRLRVVKMLKPQFAARADLRHRFQVEAKVMKGIEHPNIIHIFDSGVLDQTPFISMEYCVGGSIAAWVGRHGPMHPRMAVDIAIQICSGVSHVHDSGIVHRDIKPDNILIAADGACRVGDFGIAQNSLDLARVTDVDGAIGTVGYMAPEQFESARDVDGRADVYSVGATLWFMLMGSIPNHAFYSDPYEVGLPPAICPIVVSAVAFKRDERYPSIRALLQALEGVALMFGELPAETTPLVVGVSGENIAIRDPSLDSGFDPLETWIEPGRP